MTTHQTSRRRCLASTTQPAHRATRTATAPGPLTAQNAFNLLSAFTPTRPHAIDPSPTLVNVSPVARRPRVTPVPSVPATPNRPTPSELEAAAIVKDREIAECELYTYLSEPRLSELPAGGSLLEHWIVSNFHSFRRFPTEIACCRAIKSSFRFYLPLRWMSLLRRRRPLHLSARSRRQRKPVGRSEVASARR